MAEASTSSFKKCALGLIDLVQDATGHDLVYAELCRRDPKLKNINREAFCAEYAPAKLAMGCVYWVGCCTNHNIEDKDVRNLFFQEVMQLFNSPRSAGEAARFSESLYASNADKENSPVLGILVHLFHKLKLSTMEPSEKENEKAVSAGFCFMMEVSDALKTVFENQFDEFIYRQNEDFQA